MEHVVASVGFIYKTCMNQSARMFGDSFKIAFQPLCYSLYGDTFVLCDQHKNVDTMMVGHTLKVAFQLPRVFYRRAHVFVSVCIFSFSNYSQILENLRIV